MEKLHLVNVPHPLELNHGFHIEGIYVIVKSIFDRERMNSDYHVLVARSDHESFWGPYKDGIAVLSTGMPKVKERGFHEMQDQLRTKLRERPQAAGGQN